MNHEIYADHAATAPIEPLALEAMYTAYQEYANPAALYRSALHTKQTVEKARLTVAENLGCTPDHIFFTSGGSEADNQAIISAARIGERKGKKHIISTAFEHHAVLHTLKKLEKEGFEVTLLDVGPTGTITPQQVAEAIREDTCLVTIMYANNEIGSILPIPEIGKVCHEKGVLFHTDAVQAAGHLHINVKEQNIDMLSLSGHKFHGPKGVGVLYARQGIPLTNIIEGGAQERGKRAGTENIPGIVGLGAAVERAMRIMDSKTRKEIELRDYLIGRLENEIPHCWLNGHRTKRLPNNINFSFLFIEGESMLIMLDMKGICASSGSACTSGSLDPSHVLLAIGLKHEEAHGSLRLTLSEDSTKEEMDIVAEEVKKIVQRLRDMSPLYEDFLKSQKNN